MKICLISAAGRYVAGTGLPPQSIDPVTANRTEPGRDEVFNLGILNWARPPAAPIEHRTPTFPIENKSYITLRTQDGCLVSFNDGSDSDFDQDAFITQCGLTSPTRYLEAFEILSVNGRRNIHSGDQVRIKTWSRRRDQTYWMIAEEIVARRVLGLNRGQAAATVFTIFTVPDLIAFDVTGPETIRFGGSETLTCRVTMDGPSLPGGTIHLALAPVRTVEHPITDFLTGPGVVPLPPVGTTVAVDVEIHPHRGRLSGCSMLEGMLTATNPASDTLQAHVHSLTLQVEPDPGLILEQPAILGFTADHNQVSTVHIIRPPMSGFIEMLQVTVSSGSPDDLQILGQDGDFLSADRFKIAVDVLVRPGKTSCVPLIVGFLGRVRIKQPPKHVEVKIPLRIERR